MVVGNWSRTSHFSIPFRVWVNWHNQGLRAKYQLREAPPSWTVLCQCGHIIRIDKNNNLFLSCYGFYLIDVN